MQGVFGLGKPNKREPTSGLEPLTCSLRVSGPGLLRVARACETPRSKGLPPPRIAACCRALRSRWCRNDVRWHRFSVARDGVPGALLLMPAGAPALIRAQKAGRHKRQHAPQVRSLTVGTFSGVRRRGAVGRRRYRARRSLDGYFSRSSRVEPHPPAGRGRRLQTTTPGRQRVGPPREPLCSVGPYARETSGRGGGNIWACGCRTGPA